VAAPFRALVALDFSPESLAALKAARALVKRTGGELTVAHVRPGSLQAKIFFVDLSST
jgi:nucleotide-binding universal stress UspA family protein